MSLASDPGNAEAAAVASSLAQAIGRTYGVLAASGGAALVAALVALRIGRGDEVIVPRAACFKVPAAVHSVGAQPVFAGSPCDLLLTPEAIRAAMSPQVRGVVAVHQYGLPCDIGRIRDALDESVSIIEDIAQAWGVTAGGRQAGTAGDVAVTSFGASKPIALGAGGALMSDMPLDHIVDRLDSSQRMNRTVPLLAPFPLPLLAQLRVAIAAADEKVARQRSFAQALSGIGRIEGYRLWSPQVEDQPSWHRVPVFCRDARSLAALVDRLKRLSIPFELQHRVETAALPMFATGESVTAGVDSTLVFIRPYRVEAAHDLIRALRDE